MARLIVLLIAVAVVFGAGAVAVDSATTDATTEGGSNLTADQDATKDRMADATGNAVLAGSIVVPVLVTVAFLTGGLLAIARVF
jgi:predicted membrane-bound mannosyltransferase